ncbi:tetratricopeptide repeat protein [Marinirhabdus gelatinilytica]|uniref:Tetratricopeptide repeat protein n=1 Tax=Marinirhabdus gelatinilytica TaxID=1703343 RepID=A0A370QJ15_9FLAO|nr:tetratricopeptide repeat protein [Marinirhabdus gelatinilytica]RDK88335.1 tetratricopeptide repeat protein [Marinirhabdus gelatinilytica]
MRILLFILLLTFSVGSFAQSEALAKNYFEQGEYEKALSIYKKLLKSNPERLNYLTATVEIYQQLEQFEEAEILLRDQLNSRRRLPQLYVELGHNYTLQDKDSLATQANKQAIAFLQQNPHYAFNIGKAFESYSLLDEAVQTYEIAMQLEPGINLNPQLARIYGEQGELEKMFSAYLDLMQEKPSYRSIAQRNFSLYVSEDPNYEANTILRKTLLERLQENPDILYNELLSWLFIQQKEYKKAFIQEKAIYKRKGEDLSGIVDLGFIALNDEDYKNAEVAFNYAIENSATPEEKLRNNQYLMKIKLETATEKEYPAIAQGFEALLDTYGRGKQTYMLQIDYNHFLAFNMGKKDDAIANLKELAKEPMSRYQEARVKMKLADILVFSEQFNQALIYYSQIQNKVKNDVLAQEARFKVAKTSYYKGDFEWAQVQLDVLKKSASQLIANDAMQLSLMIRDNSLEDSTQTALKKFAKAELLSLQNKDQQAITALADILENHKGEKIEDEALLKQGKMYEKIGVLDKAEANYLKLIQFYKEDILADDAYYALAKLYENKLAQPEKAKEYYEQIIYDFADSIYFVEARKRFRTLRGDAIE